MSKIKKSSQPKEKRDQDLRKIEWMLKSKKLGKESYAPEYGDLSELNKDGLILSLIGKEQLRYIASDYLDLLETSAAVYERNGDYALGLFSSGWCRMMDAASRKLCHTSSNQKALKSGQWLCHESCWKDASLESIKKGKPIDVPCSGGLHLYAVPVRAGGEIVGSINVGYGDPPKNKAELDKLSRKYQIPVKELKKQSEKYQARPQFIVDLAKRNLRRSAAYLGSLIESKMMEKELRQSEENLRTTLHSIGDAVMATDTKGNIIRMNPIAEKLTGWKFDEVQGKKLEDFFHIENALTGEKVKNPVKKVLETGLIKDLANHTKLISKSGKEYQIADSAAPIKDNQGRISGVVFIFRDVTEDYQMLEELIVREIRFRQLFENMSSAVAVYKAVEEGYDFKFLDFNKAAEKIENISKDEVIGKRVTEVFPGVKEFGLLDVFQRVWKTGKPEEHPVSQYKDDRIAGWRDNFVYKLPTGEIVAIYDDVTELKQTEEALKKKHDEMFALFDNMEEVIYVTDMDTYEIIFVNQFTKKAFGKELVGGICYEEFQHFSEPCEFCTNEKIKELNGKPYHWEYHNPVTDHDYEIMDKVIQWPDGRKVRFELAHDITERKKAEEELASNYALLRIAGETARFGGWSVDLRTNTCTWSDIVVDIHGMPRGYSPPVEEGIKFYAPEWREKIIKVFTDCAQKGIAYDEEMEIITKQGKRVWVRTAGKPVRDKKGEIAKVQGSFQDITERKQAEIKLRESERKLSTLMSNLQGMVYSCLNDKNWTIKYVSQGGYDLTGYKPEELIDNQIVPYNDLIHPDDQQRVWETVQRALKSRSAFKLEYRIISRDNTVKWVWEQGRGVFSSEDELLSLEGFITDITERKKAEKQIKNNLREKNLLLRELYHRTKNNMQVIISMLNIAAHKTKRRATKEAFKDIVNKIFSMSLVHHKLYEAQDLSQINLKDYIEDFSRHLVRSYRKPKEDISLKMDLQDIYVSIDTAIPLGLVFSELISNVFKHAFPERKKGGIFIGLKQSKEGVITVELADNGVGVAPEIDLRKTKHMGLQNVFNLIESQVGGKVSYEVKNGLKWKISIKIDLDKKRG
ncbi:MAG: PAS domain S-box protein [Candidatus Aminicenantaceae bacterium]